MKEIRVKGCVIGGDSPLVLIAGPCVIEDYDSTIDLAERLKSLADSLSIPLIFKASYDKANRSSKDSFRGPGLEGGLKILKDVSESFSIPVLTDVHCRRDVAAVAEVVDVIQIPAFLSRQTDLIIEAAGTGRAINIKKGQFMSPRDIENVIEKVVSTRNERLMITERGVSFGYNNLVVDFRSIPVMRSYGYPVIFDVTHSVQLPGGLGSSSGGERGMIPYLARAGVATGIDGIFMEVHREPEKALCDGPNSMYIGDLPALLEQLKDIDRLVKPCVGAQDAVKEAT